MRVTLAETLVTLLSSIKDKVKAESTEEFYRTKDRGFIINKINLRREAKINKGDRVCKNKLNITGAEKFIRKKIKLIRITDLLFK